MVLGDQQMKVHEIAETIGISKERVGYIWHEELDMRKLAQDGCRACLQIKNTLTCKSLNSIWSVLTKIKLILC